MDLFYSRFSIYKHIQAQAVPEMIFARYNFGNEI